MNEPERAEAAEAELTALRERVEGLAGELEAEGFHFAKVNANPNPFQPDPSYGQGLIAASFRLRSLLSGDEAKPERCPTCGDTLLEPNCCAQCEGTGHDKPGCCPDPFHTPKGE